MVKIAFNPNFQKTFEKIKDKNLKYQIIKQIKKILLNPKIGKPMRYYRIGTREVYIKPYRLSYEYIKNEDKIVLIEFYHKDKQ